MNTDTGSKLIITEPGSRLPYYKVAYYLWGEGANIDSDGNSANQEDTSWIELSVHFSEDESPCVHVNPISENPLTLEVRSISYEFARKTSEFVSNEVGGVLEYASAYKCITR